MIFLRHRAYMKLLAILLIFFYCQLISAVEYKKDIKPIFKQYCYKCHGSEKQKAMLRMDSPDAIRKGGKSGLVVLAKNPLESDLLVRIKLPVDHDDSMPGKGKKLKEAEMRLIEAWIKSGADFGDGKITSSEDLRKVPPFKMDTYEQTLSSPNASIMKKLTDIGVLIRPLSSSGKLISVSYKFVDSEVDLRDLKELAQNISWLDLANRKLDGETFKLISQMKYLSRLSLQQSKFDEVQLQSLKDLKHLEYINLFSTAVTDKSVNAITSIKSLKKVHLWQTSFTKSGLKKLQQSLKMTKIVE